MGVTGHKGKRAPSEGERVKEERGSYGGVLGENTEKMREMILVTTEREERGRRKEEVP